MATNAHSRDERIDCRVSSDSKSLFARAAELSGVTLTSFMIESARERAIRLIEEHERLVLNNEARNVFLNALSHPPAPNANLRAAAEKYALKK
jgi:uncharacterized protein (DUF1778 family)